MKNNHLPIKLLSRALIFTIPFMLNSCTGVITNSQDNVVSTFSGSIGDGPIIDATVLIYDKNHNLIKSETGSNDATYFTRIQASWRIHPLTIEVENGFDLVTEMEPDFKLLSVVLNRRVKNTNLNPFSTIIVETAKAASGILNKKSISAARAVIMSQMNFGLNPSFVADPIGTPITVSNVAVITKASEVLGEMIRRIRDHMIIGGANIDGNDVVAALADDISDGSVDGIGGGLVNPRISALSKLVSAQVLIEALSNNLKVQGEIATSKLDSAIMDTHPSVGLDQLTDSVIINAEMLEQTRRALYAAQALVPGIELSALADIVDSIPADSFSFDIEAVLPSESSNILDSVIAYAVSASDEELELVNSSDISEKPDNTAPQLSGILPGSVSEGSNYLFTPSANDADGDILEFTISNKPLWASFDSIDGRLSGVPEAQDVGIYSNIIISVTDGLATDAIGPYSITVNNINGAPIISGSPKTNIEESSPYSFQPSASDPDGDNLVFSIIGQPFWASFDNSNGHLSGTPDEGDSGIYSNIVISASDGQVTTALPAFSIQVNAAQINIGASFTLSWTEPESREDNTVLSSSEIASYSIHYGTSSGYYPNSIDVASSEQSVTVSNLAAGTYYIAMTTTDTDGRESSYSEEITTNAQISTDGSFTLSWVEPESREDNTVLSSSEIASYSIHYGTSSGYYPNSIDAASSDQSVTVSDLPAGNYYVALTTTDTDGRESSYSEEITANVQ